MSPRTRRHPPHPHRLLLWGGEAEVPGPVSRGRTKDSAEPLTGPFLLEAPRDSFDIVRKAFS